MLQHIFSSKNLYRSFLIEKNSKACQLVEAIPLLPVDDMLQVYYLILVYS